MIVVLICPDLCQYAHIHIFHARNIGECNRIQHANRFRRRRRRRRHRRYVYLFIRVRFECLCMCDACCVQQ